jgi:alpha-D-ribose 1-methylphosphonate 5-triphosphate synthase subunit PhnG
VTRCAVRLDGVTGFGYATGRDRRKAELIAVLDALLQGEAHGPGLRKTLLPALEAKRSAARRAKAEKVGASKVDFFTMVRGEG